MFHQSLYIQKEVCYHFFSMNQVEIAPLFYVTKYYILSAMCFLALPTVAIFSISELIQMSVNPDRSLQCSWCYGTDGILIAHKKYLWKGASPLRSGNSHWVLYPETVMILLCLLCQFNLTI